MDYNYSPKAKIIKTSKPSVYLDTCAMIELSRHQSGECKIETHQIIGELYDVLMALMHRKLILCPSGNQMDEMGMTKGRKSARTFLYQFTNCELPQPDLVKIEQMKAGYSAFVNGTPEIELGINIGKSQVSNFPFRIHVAPIYSPQKADALSKNKKNTSSILNEIKNCKKNNITFEEQLCAELNAEYSLLCSALIEPTASEKAYNRYLEEINYFYLITGVQPLQDFNQQHCSLSTYSAFLQSSHHYNLPYIYIRSTLWAHLMSRPNKIKSSDNLDILWASAYLPFVDYVVTDTACCNLLQSSGLADMYGTKTYSFKTLGNLIEELSLLNK